VELRWGAELTISEPANTSRAKPRARQCAHSPYPPCCLGFQAALVILLILTVIGGCIGIQSATITALSTMRSACNLHRHTAGRRGVKWLCRWNGSRTGGRLRLLNGLDGQSDWLARLRQ
jgi:hypothetical protein